ncbi:MAG: helix-turn-helix transcriptional regulator [Oscillospiraceae bacterium]|nr:helix-turn-helix transcriptional regulator [Oscillospiraceae bacterium]
MSNIIFSQNLRKLRENKKISQKSAAASLGISQALLSHYEKGIRECKLDFLSKAAKFYNVTTDFLLGANGVGVSIGSINISTPDISDISNISGQFDENIIMSYMNKIKDSELKKDGVEINTYSILYKNLLINALSYIFDEMKDMKHKDISIISGKYLSLTVYYLYTLLYDSNTDAENNAVSSALSEKMLISWLKYIIAMKNFRADENNSANILRKYNFENPYLNNIINSNL